MAKSKKTVSEPPIHEKWRKLLEERGVKQMWLATQTGISKPHISNILAGRVKLTFGNKEKINNALGVYY